MRQQVGLNIEVAVCRLYCRCCRLVIVIAYFEQLFASILIAGHRRLMLHHLPPLFASPARAAPSRRTMGQDRQKCKETSSPLADKQQTGEHVEYKNFS